LETMHMGIRKLIFQSQSKAGTSLRNQLMLALSQ
jgi:hypothetical protein